MPPVGWLCRRRSSLPEAAQDCVERSKKELRSLTEAVATAKRQLSGMRESTHTLPSRKEGVGRWLRVGAPTAALPVLQATEPVDHLTGGSRFNDDVGLTIMSLRAEGVSLSKCGKVIDTVLSGFGLCRLSKCALRPCSACVRGVPVCAWCR